MTWIEDSEWGYYGVGEIKGYTDLQKRPSPDEAGFDYILRWERYQDIIIITGFKFDMVWAIGNSIIRSPIIPKTIKGYKVAGIKQMAFINCNVHSITIPDSIEYIGGMAVGFNRKSVFSKEEEDYYRSMNPYTENYPHSVFENKEFFLYNTPKTIIIGSPNSIAKKYASEHGLPFKALEA